MECRLRYYFHSQDCIPSACEDAWPVHLRKTPKLLLLAWPQCWIPDPLIYLKIQCNSRIQGSSSFLFNDISYSGFPGDASSKEPACQCRRHNKFGFDPWIGKTSWSRKWQPTPVFFPGKILWTEEPGGLQYLGSQRVGHYWARTHTHRHSTDIYWTNEWMDI